MGTKSNWRMFLTFEFEGCGWEPMPPYLGLPASTLHTVRRWTSYEGHEWRCSNRENSQLSIPQHLVVSKDTAAGNIQKKKSRNNTSVVTPRWRESQSWCGEGMQRRPGGRDRRRAAMGGGLGGGCDGERRRGRRRNTSQHSDGVMSRTRGREDHNRIGV
jgi:hypothetical protein